MNQSIRCLAVVASLFVGFKPIIDCAWAARVSFLSSFSLSLQGLVGIIFLAIGMVAFLSVGRRPYLKRVGLLTAATLAVIFLSVLRFRPGFEFAMKYAAGVIGVFLVPWSLLILREAGDFGVKARRRLGGAVAASLIIVVASLFLQMAGVLPWQVFDRVPIFENEIMTNLRQSVPRLTGFYYHPLDLFRAAVWPCLLMLIVLLSTDTSTRRWGLWSLMFAVYAVLAWTTHRASLALMLVAPFALGSGSGASIKRSLAVFCVVVAAWASGLLWYGKRFEVRPRAVLSVYHLVDSRYVDHGPSVAGAISPGQTPKEGTLGFARGRSWIWRAHVEWIGTFSVGELLLGSRRQFPKGDGAEAEPHNQVIDCIERFGLIGLALFAGLYGYAFMALPVSGVWKGSALATLAWYGLITEPLVMPTFTWWAMLFAGVPLWWDRFAGFVRKEAAIDV